MKSHLLLTCLSTFVLSLSLVQAEETISQSYTLIEDTATYSILNPTLKDRKMAKIILANGVQAYLISDPDIDQSAAAVSMEAGSWQDPEEYPGMAHFLEHMLFMGNEAYPEEAEYMQYIRDNGGEVNAFTASDRTVYMFSINNEAYTGALDRFCHFFVDPLFNPSCIQRELHAVDQENSKNIENDFWREYMVLKETATPGHPQTKFSTGNAQTLGGIPQEALKKWYKEHYSAEKLHLVMLSSEPLDTMIELANSRFSIVPKAEAAEEVSSYGSILSEQQLGHFIYIKPIKDLKTISLVWELPPEFASIDQKWTAELVSYVLGNESDQSLLRQLKREKIAESLSAGSERLGKEHVLFRIDIKLTDQGLSQIDTAILRCYQALARLKQTGVPLSLFQEMQTLSQIDYQYQSRQDPFSWITEVAYNIVDEDLSTFPEKTEVPSGFDPESIMQFISLLLPERATYFVLADPDALNITMDHEEKWMQVAYTSIPVPASKMTLWKQASPHSQIELPRSNPFVPTALELVSEQEGFQEGVIIPKNLSNSEKASLYFSCDDRYLVPQATLLFTIKTPKLNGSPSSAALGDLFCKTLIDDLAETLFFANSAGLSAAIFPKNFGLSLQISGYSEKAPRLAKNIFAKLKNIQCSEEDFSLYKISLSTSYANAAHELPVKQALDTLSNILLTGAPTSLEKFEALQEISFEDFSSFCKEVFHSLYIEGMIYGNLTETDALDLCSTIEQEFQASTVYQNPKKQSILLLPADKGPFKVLQTTQRQGNGVVLTLEQGSFSFPKKAAQMILSTALQEGFFDTLRTKQQTAYLARSWASEVEKQLLQTFAVQSSSHLPEDLLLRFELFLEDFDKRLSEFLPKERFERMKAAQIASIEMPPENLPSMALLLQDNAFGRDEPDFLIKEKQVQALKDLSYQDLLAHGHEFLSRKNSRRLAVLMKGEASEKPFLYEEVAKEEMLKLCSFEQEIQK